MDDEKLIELLASHDPVLGDPPPQEGSPRFDMNLENAMNLNEPGTERDSIPIQLSSPRPAKTGLTTWKVLVAAVAIPAIGLVGLNVYKYTEPDRVSLVDVPADSLPQASPGTSDAGSSGVPEAGITSVVITQTTEVRQFPDDTISDRSAEIVVNGDDYEFFVGGESLWYR